MTKISGYHHLTLSTDGVQEDYDFYTRTLGLYSVKRTVLFDGVLPVYRLYYGARNGDASTIITTFPFKKPGVFGRRGSNQSKVVMQSIPVGASDFWVNRLNEMGIKAVKTARFGADRVVLEHPCGIPHELVENPSDNRTPIANPDQGVTAEHGIKGILGGVLVKGAELKVVQRYFCSYGFKIPTCSAVAFSNKVGKLSRNIQHIIWNYRCCAWVDGSIPSS